MILVCNGSHTLPFHRMTSVVNTLAKNNIKIVYQHGHTPIKEKLQSVTYIPFLQKEEFAQYQKDSTIVITHGGVNSIFEPLLLGKPVIVLPRLQDFNEHNDNHQQQIVHELKNRGMIEVLEDINDIVDIVDAINTNKKQYNSFTNNNQQMIDIIKSYIEQ